MMGRDLFAFPTVNASGVGHWSDPNHHHDGGEISLRRDSHKIRRDIGLRERDYSPSSGDFEMIYDQNTPL
jgi:hypothetical protein